MIDRTRVSRSFHRGAKHYEDLTPVQGAITTTMVEHLQPYLADAHSLLDIGCGTGRLLKLLAQLEKHPVLYGLDLAPNMIETALQSLETKASLQVGDAEHLPFADQFFDLVVSTSTFQWLDDLAPCFAEVRRVLRPGGRFVFSLFGAGTLAGIQECWRLACRQQGLDVMGAHDGTHHFHTPDDIRMAFERVGLRTGSVSMTQETVWYPDVLPLLQAIKQIGANTSQPMGGKGLGWRRVFGCMAEIYKEKYGGEQGVPARYVTLWGEASV